MKSILLSLLLALSICLTENISAQELNCKVVINHSQIQGTNTSVFETLQSAINEFMNNRSWTELQFNKDERIDCTLNITIKQYKEAEGSLLENCCFRLHVLYSIPHTTRRYFP